MTPTVSKQIEQLIAEHRAKRLAAQDLALEEFRACGEFRLSENMTKGLEDVVCEIDWDNEPAWPSFIYLFRENGVVRYVGETGIGTRRLSQYRRDYGGPHQGSRISGLIFQSLLDGRTVEILLRDTPLNQGERRKVEARLIQLFGSLKPAGWNIDSGGIWASRSRC